MGLGCKPGSCRNQTARDRFSCGHGFGEAKASPLALGHTLGLKGEAFRSVFTARKRVARKLLLRKPSAAATGARLRSLGPFVLFQPAARGPLVSLRSTALSLTCLRQVDGGAALPRPKLCCGSKLVPRAFVFCAAVLRSRSRPWGLCPQTSATFEKVDETFDSRSFVSLSLWLFLPARGALAVGLCGFGDRLLLPTAPQICNHRQQRPHYPRDQKRQEQRVRRT